MSDLVVARVRRSDNPAREDDPVVALDAEEAAEAMPLDADELAEHDAAAAEVEEDFRNGRYITADQYFAGVRNPM